MSEEEIYHRHKSTLQRFYFNTNPTIGSSEDINITIQNATGMHVIPPVIHPGRHTHRMASGRQEVLLRRFVFVSTRSCPLPEHIWQSLCASGCTVRDQV
jgi:hypothetical protein